MEEQYIIKLEGRYPIGYPISIDNFKQITEELKYSKKSFFTSSELLSYGYAPFKSVHRPIVLEFTGQEIKPNPLEEYNEVTPTEQTSNGEWIQKWEIVPKSFDNPEEEAIAMEEYFEFIKNKKINSINKIRNKRIYQRKISYTFPGDTEPDLIQMRDEKDRQNVQDIYADAVGFIMEGNPDKLINFMPESNIIKSMTAAQIRDMGRYLKSRGDDIMAYSWNLKDQVRNTTTIDALNLIDILDGWPHTEIFPPPVEQPTE